MSILHVRNVPEALYRRLKERAEAQRRSLSAEVITLLEWAVAEAERRPEATLRAIRARRRFDPGAAGAPESTALLREDRAR
jgi:plasmid stability protein